MPVQFHATCECGYKSRSLRGNTCVCRSCNEIVDIPRVPFRYELSACPKCGATGEEENILLNLLGKGYLVTDRPSALPCPKCNNTNIRFHLDATISMIYGVEFPGVGDEIDGSMTRNGKLDIPWFTLEKADVQHDVPENISQGQRVRLRVDEIATEKPTDTVTSMFYRFVVTKLKLSFVRKLC